MHALSLESWHAAQQAVFPEGDRVEVSHYRDPAAEYRRSRESVALFDASGRDRLVVSGDDRVSFIQGLCSNDVERIDVGGSVEAAFITPKGKLVADARITKLEDALLFDFEAGRAAALDEVLTKYRVDEVVEWGDVSEILVALELWGPKTPDVLGVAIERGQSQAVSAGGSTFAAVGTSFGAILYVPADAAEAVATDLLERASKLGGGLAGRGAIDVRRIELGLGRYGVDWDENTNPLEAGMDRALDYKKGCYVGQEVVAKATYIGHVNRRLVRLAWDGAPVAANTPLIGGRSPGRVTSNAAVAGTGRVVALGYVRRDSAAEGSKHRVGEGGPEATVLGYPFESREKPV